MVSVLNCGRDGHLGGRQASTEPPLPWKIFSNIFSIILTLSKKKGRIITREETNIPTVVNLKRHSAESDKMCYDSNEVNNRVGIKLGEETMTMVQLVIKARNIDYSLNN